jgi:transposase
MVELARSGRTASELAREFELTSQAIGDWVRKADAEERPISNRLTDDERAELRRLRQENKRLRTEREILSKAAA